jgi:hypothetical protein
VLVTIFRRHLGACPHRAEGRAYDKCRCPIHADARPMGTLVGLRTSDRKIALQLAREMELTDVTAKTRLRTEIAEARNLFLETLKFRNLAKSTQRSYQTFWRQLCVWAKGEGLRFVDEIDAAAAARFAMT